MSVGWDVKWCPVSRIPTPLASSHSHDNSVVIHVIRTTVVRIAAVIRSTKKITSITYKLLVPV